MYYKLKVDEYTVNHEKKVLDCDCYVPGMDVLKEGTYLEKEVSFKDMEAYAHRNYQRTLDQYFTDVAWYQIEHDLSIIINKNECRTKEYAPNYCNPVSAFETFASITKPTAA